MIIIDSIQSRLQKLFTNIIDRYILKKNFKILKIFSVFIMHKNRNYKNFFLNLEIFFTDYVKY